MRNRGATGALIDDVSLALWQRVPWLCTPRLGRYQSNPLLLSTSSAALPNINRPNVQLEKRDLRCAQLVTKALQHATRNLMRAGVSMHLAASTFLDHDADVFTPVHAAVSSQYRTREPTTSTSHDESNQGIQSMLWLHPRTEAETIQTLEYLVRRQASLDSEMRVGLCLPFPSGDMQAQAYFGLNDAEAAFESWGRITEHLNAANAAAAGRDDETPRDGTAADFSDGRRELQGGVANHGIAIPVSAWVVSALSCPLEGSVIDPMRVSDTCARLLETTGSDLLVRIILDDSGRRCSARQLENVTKTLLASSLPYVVPSPEWAQHFAAVMGQAEAAGAMSNALVPSSKHEGADTFRSEEEADASGSQTVTNATAAPSFFSLALRLDAPTSARSGPDVLLAKAASLGLNSIVASAAAQRPLPMQKELALVSAIDPRGVHESGSEGAAMSTTATAAPQQTSAEALRAADYLRAVEGRFTPVDDVVVSLSAAQADRGGLQMTQCDATLDALEARLGLIEDARHALKALYRLMG
jgi:hypothetical protein